MISVSEQIFRFGGEVIGQFGHLLDDSECTKRGLNTR